MNNKCIIFLKDCIIYSPDGLKCLKCTPETQLDSGCCKSYDLSCINYDEQCFCIACMTKFYLSPQGRC